MLEMEFWEIIESASPKYDNQNAASAHCQKVMNILDSKSDQDLTDFYSYFRKYFYELLNYDLWSVAMLVPDQYGDQGCSDDTFTNFCAGIISRGRKTFENVKKNPDCIAEIKEPQLLKSGEAIMLAAPTIFRKRHGKYAELDDNEEILSNTPIKIIGQLWDGSDYGYFSRKFPKCLLRFGLPQ